MGKHADRSRACAPVGFATPHRSHPDLGLASCLPARRWLAAALASRGVNVTDLQTKLAGEDASPLYVMMLEVELRGADAGELRTELGAIAGRAAVPVTMRGLAAEAL